MAKDSIISIPVDANTRIEDNDVNHLADEVRVKLMKCMEEGFDQRLTAKMCAILYEAQETAKAQGIGFSISNPFHVKLLNDKEYEIYFEDYTFEDSNGKECQIPAGAAYRVLECGVERVW